MPSTSTYDTQLATAPDLPCIAVVFGGHSPEYPVSLESATSVITNLDTDRYEIVMVGITRTGSWYHYTGPVEAIADDSWITLTDELSPAILSPDRATAGLLVFDEAGAPPRIIELDGVLPLVHGQCGEDGTLIGLIELSGLPLIGCNTAASSLCMDKDRSHKLVKDAGIRVPRALTAYAAEDRAQVKARVETMGELPLFVKPVRAGSSFGISVIDAIDELDEALDKAFEHDTNVIIEEAITGVECGCAVIGRDDHLTVGEVDEIEIHDTFFDYEEKYTLTNSAIHLPARLPQSVQDALKDSAKTIYRALGCTGFARVDMFVTPDHEIVFNEVNTIPGFTSHSRFPQMQMARGISYTELLTEIIEECRAAWRSALAHQSVNETSHV